ncbi:PEP-CTERM system histidine kinase PrsK [Noviherbaspirillum cavernae]|uniref:histidine kinase n=1 Tax=Noviherbaspirillum cavernae TaxID=2320862 RepID=A0A418X3M0_9BURK|nr:XrtA/PEP-CTERM system histidine kinase PrsK [Noviherbaspirillum cavernae]RJG07057.1 PEP-CTERM system histidine kinase PrsK [Noviherbaspirillum cavernae]
MVINVATFSYGIAAAAFFFLAMLLLTVWRGRIHGKALAVTCLATALWAAATAAEVASGKPLTLVTQLLEIVRNAGWFILLLLLMSPAKPASIGDFLGSKPAAQAITMLFVVLFIATICAYLQMDFAIGLMALISGAAGRVLLAVVGMLLVEQLFRRTPPDERWAIKFACLGIGGLFAYDFYLYSDAMLFRRVNAEIWSARGVANALTVPLLLISTARDPRWSFGIAVSRRALFHSVALFGSAIYLLTMAAAGYYLRYAGGDWGAVVQLGFLFGAVILLIATLFSGAFRSRLKVFISKHFYHYNYDYREEWIRFTRTLSESGPGVGERAIKSIAELVESPGGALFVHRGSGNCEAIAGWNLTLNCGSDADNEVLCRFLERTQWVVDMHEHDQSPGRYEGLVMPEWVRTSPRTWLLVPLILHGKLFGFVVLLQSRSSINLNWEVLDLLKIAGSQAASYLAQHEAANALVVARQFESFNRMSTFMVHDLKNLVSQLSLMLANAEKHKDKPEFQEDMLGTVEHSIQKMKMLLHKLSRSTSLETPSPISVGSLLRLAVGAKSAFEPKPALELPHDDAVVFANDARLERVIGHLIQNAIEAAPRNGSVTVRLRVQEDQAVIEVADNGPGMSEAFIRDRLFKPFESTKSAGMGIGVFETREYMSEIGGKLEVMSRPSIGTTFRMLLPLHQDGAQTILNAA